MYLRMEKQCGGERLWTSKAYSFKEYSSLVESDTQYCRYLSGDYLKQESFTLREKCPNKWFFLIHIFPYLD